MSGRLRRTLERRREELAGTAAARLVDEPDADVGRELARLDAINKALGALPVPRWRTALGPAAMALVCLTAVGALWTVTIDKLGLRTGVVLAVDAGTVELRVTGDDDWKWSDRLRLAGGRLDIGRAELAYSDPGRGFPPLPGDASLAVEADSMTFQELSLGPGTAMTLERTDGEALAIYANGGHAGGSVLVNGPVSLTWRDTDDATPETKDLQIELAPETITFNANRPPGVPARIVFQPGGPLTLRDLPVSRLRFGREVPEAPGEPVFVSTVRGGRLQIPDVDETHDLSVGYSVILDGLDGHIRQLRVGDDDVIAVDLDGRVHQLRVGHGDAIAVDLEGTVERVAVGPWGRERNATSSLLAYLYHNQRLAFLFAAASFVWGTLWSLRRLVGV